MIRSLLVCACVCVCESRIREHKFNYACDSTDDPLFRSFGFVLVCAKLRPKLN